MTDGEVGQLEVGDLVADQLDLHEVRLVLEDAVLDARDGILVQRDRLKTDRQGQLGQGLLEPLLLDQDN